MAGRLNLARRPFVDTRPVNVAVGVLALVALVLTVLSWRTVTRYYADSARTRSAIAALRTELDALEETRRAREAALARYDVAALAASARDANALARQKAFSWTRFLSRLERALPADALVAGISLSRPDTRENELAPVAVNAYPVGLTLLSNDPDAMPRILRAFYASPYFDRPVPHHERSPDEGKDVHWRVSISVTYLDGGKS